MLKKFNILIIFLLLFSGCLNQFEQEKISNENNLYNKTNTNDAFGLHATWDRVDEVNDLNVNTIRGFYHFTEQQKQKLDDILELYQSHNIDIVITLQPDNEQWGNKVITRIKEEYSNPIIPGLITGYPSDIEAYKKDLRILVEGLDTDGIADFSSVQHPFNYFQVDNEVFWDWYGNPPENISSLNSLITWRENHLFEVYQSYGTFLQITYDTIKDVNPNAKVILGDIFISEENASIPEHASLILTNYTSKYEILDFHFYGNSSSLSTKLNTFKELNLTNKSIWALELGGPMQKTKFTSADEAKHATELVKMHMIAFSWGVDKIFWSSLIQTPGWPQSFLNTALLRSNYEKKPAYYSYQLLSKKLGNISSIEKINDGFYKFVSPSGKLTIVVWNTKDTQEVLNLSSFFPSPQVTVTHIITQKETNSPKIEVISAQHVNIGNDPIFVE